MKITYQGDTRFAAETRGHKIIVDLPSEKGGTDRGMSPPELFAASFGACIGVYIADYCKRTGMSCEGMTVDVESERAEEPARIGRLHARVNIPAGIPDGRRAAVQKVAEHCLIHATLCNQPELMVELT